jgi:predicted ATPase
MDGPPYLTGCYAVPERIPAERAYPFDLPFFDAGFDMTFRSPIVVIAGENGTGKSTLIESLAALCSLSPWGGSRAEAGVTGESSGAVLAKALRPRFRRRPRDAFFFRAETLFSFAELLEERDADPDFLVQEGIRADPFAQYGGRSLHTRSHGEAFLAVMENRLRDGLFLFDEPEAALSPRRQLEFAQMMAERAASPTTQIIMATHSPLLMTIPGAELHLIDGISIRRASVQETPQWAVLSAVLADPPSFWRSLPPRAASDEE